MWFTLRCMLALVAWVLLAVLSFALLRALFEEDDDPLRFLLRALRG